MGMVEVEVKERVGDGRLLSFVAFELLSGVFKKTRQACP
jgi:hypothetical protein